MFSMRLISMNKVLPIVMSLSMLFAYIPNPSDKQAHAAEVAVDSEWDELQQLLSGIKGEWNDQNYNGAITNGMPDTALLGNGDIGITSAGGKGYKSFYLSKGDFWTAKPGVSFTGLGNITIKQAQDEQDDAFGTNLALDAVATASSQHENFNPGRAVNGLWTSGYEGWVTTVGKLQWVVLDLGESKKISRYIIKHDGAARPNEKSNNTRDFTVQKSDDGIVWVDIDSVSNNNADITDRSISAVTTRYIKVNITTPTQNINDGSPRARIGQIELYENAANVNLALNASATANNHYENFIPSRAVNGAWKSGYEGWVTAEGKQNWLALDLGKEKIISRYIVKHDGAARPLESANNTKDFVLQKSDDGTTWVDVDSVNNNKANITDRTITPITTRYIRLYITEPTQGGGNPRARIGQIELYEFPEITEEPEEDTSYFKEEQNILNAEIDTWMNIGGVEVTMKTWTAANDNVMVTELTSRGNESVELEVITAVGANPSYPANAGVDGDAIWVTRETPSGGKWVSRAALTTRIIGADDIQSAVISKEKGAKTTFVLKPGQKVQVVTAVGGGGQDPINHLQEAINIAGGQSNESLNTLFVEHREWWKNYWLKSHITLNDNLLEKFYYGSLYFMGSSSREGKVAPGIFGIWATTDNPKWNGDMHLNYNFIAPFYGVYSSNRPELALSMYDLFLDYVPEAKRRAQEDLRRLKPNYIDERFPAIQGVQGVAGGMLFPVGIGPFGSTTDDNYWSQVVNSLFSVSQFIAYYDYTQDKEFLRNTAYSFMKDTAEFFEYYLEYEELTGKYVIYSGHHEGAWAKNSGSDLGLLRYLLSHLISASEELEVDEDKRPIWKNILDNLAEQPTSQYNGKTIYSLADAGTSNDGRDIHPGDNTVNLEFIHPGEVLGIYSDPSKLQIAIDTLDIMNSWGQENSFPKVFTQAARVGYPAQSLINKLKQQLSSKMAPNFRVIDSNHGIEKAGAIEAINNMLVQSFDGIIKVFPVWPEGNNASFKRLREKGAFLVSSELTNGVVSYIDITSEAGKPVKLESPWSVEEVNIVEIGGGAIDYERDGKFISFKTEPGKQYVVTPGVPVEEAVELTVTTVAITGVTMTTAIVSGEVTADDGDVITERGIVYSTTPDPTLSNSILAVAGTTGSYTAELTELTPGTTYYVRAYAMNSIGTSYGSNKSFTTNVIPKAPIDPVTPPIETPPVDPVSPPKNKPFYNEMVNIDVIKALVEKAKVAPAVRFTDIPEDFPSAKAIEIATKLGIINGYADGSFQANAEVTRAEFATMLVKALGLTLTSEDESSFKDTKDHWATDAIATLKESGIINGYLDGTFKPNQTISRAEIVAMLSKVMNITFVKEAKFNDIVGSWAEAEVNTLADMGIVKGTNDGSFKPKDHATRSESLLMILRMLNVSLGHTLDIE